MFSRNQNQFLTRYRVNTYNREKGGSPMKDQMIVELYLQRDESAIQETEKSYGNYLRTIAYNILSNIEDSKESVNDTYLNVWNSIPPHKPNVLSTYLVKLTRRASIDIYRKRSRDKRKASEYAISLSELDDCVSKGDTTAQSVDLNILAKEINIYLRTLSEEARNTFIGRYYFMDSIRDISAYYGMSQSKVKSMLHRTRIGLRTYLEQGGFDL